MESPFDALGTQGAQCVGRGRSRQNHHPIGKINMSCEIQHPKQTMRFMVLCLKIV